MLTYVLKEMHKTTDCLGVLMHAQNHTRTPDIIDVQPVMSRIEIQIINHCTPEDGCGMDVA